ncbi:NHLP bacteriocin export ABC transporter permease/ATPase subunit [Nostoc sp. PA-18-2419]|uniref:NHLP bacteriocin export ABC transporter permease/ATPase subunit n=1 Tax=Nostoc sp. PA-18-2419 TaxID=2575443 RepID=UPI0011088A00|nr:NHLP bacteriocin export ABC transporter permease/ATPase subunit [Nostoc sp. PA-18-2419]
MIEPSGISSLPGEVYKFKGNHKILLNDPQSIWVVRSGVIAVVATLSINGVPEGSRHYLFSTNPGEAMFGTPSCSSKEQRQLMAVTTGKAELLKVSFLELSRLIVGADTSAIALVENWICQLDSIFSDAPTPQISLPGITNPIQSLQTRFLDLTDSQTLQPQSGSVSWLEISQGNAQWMGLDGITIDNNFGILPLSPKMWLRANGTVESIIYPTSAVHDLDTLVRGIANLHNLVLQYIDRVDQQEVQKTRLRLHQRETLDLQITEETLRNLASILQPQQQQNFSSTDTPLLVAMGAVGRVLGVKIRPPAKSEDMSRVKDPLEAIGRASGVRMRRVLLTDQWWFEDCGPLLGYTQNNSPVALIPVGNNRYNLFDPVAMTRIPVNAQIAATLSLEAYTFYRPLPNRSLKAMDVLQFALKGRGWDLLVIAIAAISATLLNMLIPIFTGQLVNEVIPNAEQGLLFQMGAVLFTAAFGVAIFKLTQGFTLLRLEAASDALTQAAVWDRVLKLKASFFREYSTGDLRSRISAITDIRRQLSGSTLTTLLSSFFALLNLGLMFYYSWELALVASVITLLSIIITIIYGILKVNKNRFLLALEGELFGIVVQLLNGVSKLRVSGAEKRAFAYWGKQYYQRAKLNLGVQMIEDSLNLFNEVLSPVSLIFLFWIAVFSIRSQAGGTAGLAIGSFIAFNSAFSTFISSATSLSNTIVDSLNIVNLWQRAQPILLAQPEVDDNKVDPGSLLGRLALDHVTFRYREDRPIILDDVSIHAGIGEFIALVGGSGSGKSTIFRLLLGFETPEAGVVYYDTQDLSKLNLQAVRRQMGVVLQNGRLQSASIFDNIAGSALITEEEAWEAAKMAGIADDIAAMPMKMHTVVSEGGSNFSGGQRQRLLIAKALALKPKILLFDEATSALDNKTQAIVSASMNKLQVTRVVIAHRLSTIRNADRIYVLQTGRIVQQGSFEELANQDGLFAQLMARQMT